jgi:tyrosine-protein phosphatase YwqE
MSETTVVLSTGGVEYRADDASVSIDDLIMALEEAKEDGATHVVAASGNHRGAKYARLYAEVTWP